MRKYIFFTVIRYIEFSLFSIMMFLLARSIPASELGLAAPSFILITFSAFILLGGNQVLIKWYSKEVNNLKKNSLILYNLAINIVACIISYFFLLAVVDPLLANSVALIGAGKIIVECMATLNRVNSRFQRINLIYLSNIIPLTLMFFIVGIEKIGDFFIYWSYSILFAVTVSILLTEGVIRTVLKDDLGRLYCYINNNLKSLFINGIKLAFIGLLAPLIGSIDKLILSYTEFDKSLLGSMQLADNIASAIALGAGSLFFMLTPNLIKKLSDNLVTIDIINKYGYLCLLLAMFFFNFSFFLGNGILQHFFPDYMLLYPLMIQVSTKLLISGLFMYNVITMAFSDENFYLRILTYILPIHIVTILLIVNTLDEDFQFYIVPIVGLVSLLIMHILTFTRSMKIQRKIRN